MAPRLHVPPPTWAALPYGLLSVAQTRFDEPDPHWATGVTYQPLCGSGASTYDACLAVTGTGAPPDPGAKTVTAEFEARGATPFTVYAEIQCSAPNFYAEAQARAAEALSRTEAWQVERIFWTGLAGGQTVAFPHLAADAEVSDASAVLLQTAASVVVTGSVDIVEGLGLLEEALGDCYDGVGIIHVPTVLIPAMANANLLMAQGPRLRTPNGHWVAAGAGYPGTAPDGTSTDGVAYMYATGAVFAYRSAPFVNPTPSILDRATNTVTVIAERTYVLGWDCCHFAVPISTGGITTGTVGAAT